MFANTLPMSPRAFISTRCTMRTVPGDSGPPRLLPDRSSALYRPWIMFLSTA
ncbi:hypothetical protein KZZ52_14525 [Dactylosporangium sp. AC04546]|uniref:hypothetical protein n=1 Tax=Dactylosporangium sp. AC04546 TaxID=2862460 RepID=UPI001EE09604|nr:hypothetical protein [Dactylosporangium sp. AC04546]WVK86533.1 hypothetical protein KZZ52_14525 [Dactylosporangium sp. AC04546]